MIASRTTRILFAAALLAVAAFALLELPRRRAQDRAAGEDAPLFQFEPATIDGIRILRRGDELAFAMRDSHWEMTAPLHELAEPSNVAALLQALHTASVERNLGEDDDAKNDRFGLRAPSATIWLAAARDTVARLELGDYTIDRAFVYARRGDHNVVLVPTDLLRASTLPVDQYRNRRIVNFDRSVVRSFDLRTPQGRSRWTRSPGGGWFTTVARDTVVGDSVAVEGILRTLRGLRVARFLAAPDTAGALDDADVVVTLHKTPPAPPVTIRLRCAHGVPCRARCDDEVRVSELDSDVDAVLSAGIDNLRDRHLLNFAPEHAGRIEISTPDTSAVLVRAGERWALPNPALGAIDPARAADLVRALRALRWTRVVDRPTTTNLSHNSVAVIVYARDGSILDGMRGSISGDPPVVTGTSRSSGRATEWDIAVVRTLSTLLRRLRP